jgi:polyphosphate kinase
MSDIISIFHYLEQPKNRRHFLQACKTLMVCPTGMRKQLLQLINNEIKSAKAGKPASITLKVNSLSDEGLIEKLQEAAKVGVTLQMVIRGICCMRTENPKFKEVEAISIVDEQPGACQVMIFHNGGKEKVFISSVTGWFEISITA